MAQKLAAGLKNIKGINVTQSVDANSIFAVMPTSIIPILQEEHFFYVWNERTNEVRLMCSFDTTEEEINNFLKRIKSVTG
jgi:threonine aldolase